MSKTVQRTLIAALVLAGIGGIAFYIAVEHVLPYSIIRPHRITHEEIVNAVHGDVSPEFFGLRSEPFNITVDDSIALKGWFIHADSSRPSGTVVILHGIASCKESMLPRARNFARAGLNSIVFDLRAHGESGGQFCTFGYYEKRDVSRYIDSALARFDSAVGPVAVWGGSLGAAVAIQAMEADPRIRCGVVESPFATLREVVFDYMKRMSGISLHSVADLALTRAGELARFPVDSIRPEESARHVRQPVMVVHGLQDEHISPDYGKRIFQNLCSTDKVWIPLARATHFTISSVGGEAYKKQIADFFLNHVRQYGNP
jgi:alpha-beta hydrolase superfamily lysophospholipase